MFCPRCGKPYPDDAGACASCGLAFSAAQSLPPKEEGDATGGIIPYKNAPALIAYYCGVFSIIPCFPIGIAAVVLGIKGLKRARENPAVRGQVHAWIGIIAGGLFGLLWAIVTVLVIIGISKGRFGG
ncbi:MAG: hypothetical protein NTW87_05890 [Planctomycetota bacterium]|nr:hypothetical protein [Planctomycetota bacterium]